MPITAVELIPYRLPFVTPWQSVAGRWHERQGWLIRLTDRAGRCGYGDAAPLPSAGTETLEQTRRWLDRQHARLIGEAADQSWRKLPEATDCPAARCGLETALLDLQAKQRGVALYQLLGATTVQPVPLNAAIGRLDSRVTQRATAAVNAGFSILKLKLGLAPPETELAQLSALCRQLPDGIRLRLDANRAWPAGTARELIRQLNRLPIESLEEPLQQPDPDTLCTLQALADFDLALDESLPPYLGQPSQWAIPVNRLIIKPTCLGGLTPSLKLIQAAYRQGLNCVITSTLESSAGLWPLCHLAAAANALTAPAIHGLATAAWFARDIGHPPPISAGHAVLGTEPGTGFILE
ncbi:o-succinylbenzoate synthase [Sedimenticola sp.]|uniref:o-succinylbenzoate synthase n=1 Tax=Sedimenticola sp. TaxID=1940285 RepID=UPI003D0A2C3D